MRGADMMLNSRRCCCEPPEDVCTTSTIGFTRRFPIYDEAGSYAIDDKVTYDGDVYVATTASSDPAGVWNASHWSITADDPNEIKDWEVIEGSVSWDGDVLVMAANSTIELDLFATFPGFNVGDAIAVDLPVPVTRLRVFHARSWAADQLYDHMEYFDGVSTVAVRDAYTSTRDTEWLGPYVEIVDDAGTDKLIFGEVTYGVCEERMYSTVAQRQILPPGDYIHRQATISQGNNADLIFRLTSLNLYNTVARYRKFLGSATTVHCHAPVAYKTPTVDGPRPLIPFQPTGFASPITDSLLVNQGQLKIRTYGTSERIGGVRGELIDGCNVGPGWGSGLAEASPSGYTMTITIDLVLEHLTSPNAINFTQNMQTEFEIEVTRQQFSHVSGSTNNTSINRGMYRVTHDNATFNGSSGWISFWYDAEANESYIELVTIGVSVSGGSPPDTEYFALRFTAKTTGLFSTATQSHSMSVEAIAVDQPRWTNYADVANSSGTVSW